VCPRMHPSNVTPLPVIPPAPPPEAYSKARRNGLQFSEVDGLEKWKFYWPALDLCGVKFKEMDAKSILNDDKTVSQQTSSRVPCAWTTFAQLDPGLTCDTYANGKSSLCQNTFSNVSLFGFA
jgi:hypothetical protein